MLVKDNESDKREIKKRDFIAKICVACYSIKYILFYLLLIIIIIVPENLRERREMSEKDTVPKNRKIREPG